MADEERFCIYCDKPVKKIVGANDEKIWGKGETHKGEFIHVAARCNKQFLTESEIYTEEDSDPSSAS